MITLFKFFHNFVELSFLFFLNRMWMSWLSTSNRQKGTRKEAQKRVGLNNRTEVLSRGAPHPQNPKRFPTNPYAESFQMRLIPKILLQMKLPLHIHWMKSIRLGKIRLSGEMVEFLRNREPSRLLLLVAARAISKQLQSGRNGRSGTIQWAAEGLPRTASHLPHPRWGTTFSTTPPHRQSLCGRLSNVTLLVRVELPRVEPEEHPDLLL